MELLHSYTNGNSKVSIYNDGTKIREYEGEFKPIHFESADVKITNMCDGKCKFCHEKSSPQGTHADVNKLLEILSPLPAGVELAYGGGNVLNYPQLMQLLQASKEHGWIPNMTVNERHIEDNKKLLIDIITNKLIYGLGISFTNNRYIQPIIDLMNYTNNIVFHVIMGINPVSIIDELNSICTKNNKHCKILILGYKDYGLGKGYLSSNKEAIDTCKLQWYRYLATYFNHDKLTLSFDNLAIDQLNLKRFFTDKAWNKFYMGNEGAASMYIDAVNQQYAICSVDPNRVSWNDMSLFEFFQKIPR